MKRGKSMPNITADKLNKYIDNNKPEDKIILDYGDFQITVRTSLSLTEQHEFIYTVTENAFVDFVPSPLNIATAFDITFAQMLTDLPIPTTMIDGKETVDSESLYETLKVLNLIKRAEAESATITELLCNLWRYINKVVEYKNQQYIACMSSASDETLNTLNTVIHRGVDFLDMLINQLEKNGNKLFKNLTQKNMNAWVNNLQQAFIKSAKQKDGYAVMNHGTNKNGK